MKESYTLAYDTFDSQSVEYELTQSEELSYKALDYDLPLADYIKFLNQNNVKITNWEESWDWGVRTWTVTVRLQSEQQYEKITQHPYVSVIE